MRKKVMTNLLAMDESARTNASRMIGQRLLQVANDAHYIMAFWPLPSEPDITGVLEDLMSRGKCLSLPWIKGNSLTPLSVNNFTTLIHSNLGVYTPDPTKAEELPPRKTRPGDCPWASFHHVL